MPKLVRSSLRTSLVFLFLKPASSPSPSLSHSSVVKAFVVSSAVLWSRDQNAPHKLVMNRQQRCGVLVRELGLQLHNCGFHFQVGYGCCTLDKSPLTELLQNNCKKE